MVSEGQENVLALFPVIFLLLRGRSRNSASPPLPLEGATMDTTTFLDLNMWETKQAIHTTEFTCSSLQRHADSLPLEASLAEGEAPRRRLNSVQVLQDLLYIMFNFGFSVTQSQNISWYLQKNFSWSLNRYFLLLNLSWIMWIEVL